MKFKSKSEAYSYILFQLCKLAERCSEETNTIIFSYVKEIQICFENHEQNPEVVCQLLEKFINTQILNPQDSDFFHGLIEDIRQQDYIQTVEDKFDNPLARRFESELPILLLQSPTEAMMASVNRLSQLILDVLRDMHHDDSGLHLIQSFMTCLTDKVSVLSFGAFAEPPSLKKIKYILKNNDPAHFVEIMHIHFKFSLTVFREYPIQHAPQRDPVGKLAEIIKYKWTETDHLADFFGPEGIGSHLPKGKDYRSFLADMLFYQSDLFTAGLKRGRKGDIVPLEYNQTGLMLFSQKSYAKGFPTHSSKWVADCKCQAANLNSRHVLDEIENDSVYVSGASGMTCLLLTLMEILANFETVELKQHYLSAIFSYIISAGFHSFHEVIGPAEYILNLVPGYHVQPPVEDGPKAPPPNFNAFYTQQAAIDPEFSDRCNRAWENYLNFFYSIYGPKNIEGFDGSVFDPRDETRLGI